STANWIAMPTSPCSANVAILNEDPSRPVPTIGHMLPDGLFIADAHEDLAYHCQEYARDLVDPADAACMITLPWLIATGVRLICATLFTPHTTSPEERRA